MMQKPMELMSLQRVQQQSLLLSLLVGQCEKMSFDSFVLRTSD